MNNIVKNTQLPLCFLFFLILSTVDCGKFMRFDFRGRENMLFIPEVKTPGAPLFVMIHGCTQSPIDFAESSRMNAVAERLNAYVLYPQQRYIDNIYKCWNWFLIFNQIRDYGEPELIASMTNEILKMNQNIDPNKVFVAGFSSGGALAAILAVTYPDIFSGVGVASGLEYKAADNPMDAFYVMKEGGPNPVKIGKAAFKDMGKLARAVRTIIFHGDADDVVYPVNGEQVVVSSVVMNSLAEVPDLNFEPNTTYHTVPGGRQYSISDYKSKNTVYVRKVTVRRMVHAWSGGSKGASYSDPTGPDASTMLASFWLNCTLN